MQWQRECGRAIIIILPGGIWCHPRWCRHPHNPRSCQILLGQWSWFPSRDPHDHHNLQILQMSLLRRTLSNLPQLRYLILKLRTVLEVLYIYPREVIGIISFVRVNIWSVSPLHLEDKTVPLLGECLKCPIMCQQDISIHYSFFYCSFLF